MMKHAKGDVEQKFGHSVVPDLDFGGAVRRILLQ